MSAARLSVYRSRGWPRLRRLLRPAPKPRASLKNKKGGDWICPDLPLSVIVKLLSLAPLRGGIMKEKVQAALDKVRPSLQADGGDIELVDVKNGIVSVRLQGHCAG